MSSMVKTVFSVAAGLLVIACAGGGYLVYQTKKAADDAITSATYGKIKKGDSQDSVRKLIGGNHEAAKIAVKDTQPAVPAGSACDYALEKSSDHAYRFCYIGGKLVQKDEIKMADGSKK